MEANNSKVGIAVATLVAGLLVGGVAGYAVGGNSVAETTPTDTSGSMERTEEPANGGADGVTVGGAKMVRDLDIVDNAANAKNVTTVVAAVKAAGLVETLKGAGPFTVFGPDNAAFEKLPAGTVDTLLKPENKDQLTAILTYHVVPGTYTSADLKVMAQKGEALTTVQGAKLTPVLEDNVVKLKDVKDNVVDIETADVISSNGVTHVIKSVLMPQ